MEIGKKIKQLRAKAGLTQEQLASRLDVTPQAISKWENDAAMPDIATLPVLAETFGVTIDDLFDLTVEQRFNRIESRLDIEETVSEDLFHEYESFLSEQKKKEEFQERALFLLTYLYWHRMNSFAQKVKVNAKEAIRRSPGKKECQWMLSYAEYHAAWDWNISSHTAAINFYKDLAQKNPSERLPLEYLLDNLIADHRVNEAEEALAALERIGGANPALIEGYRAGIALARFNEPEADRIMERLIQQHPDESSALFEVAQYYAKKGNYEKAIDLYEQSFVNETRRPRFSDELQSIADIYEILGETKKAMETYDRIIDLLKNEWGFVEETVLKDAKEKRAKLASSL